MQNNENDKGLKTERHQEGAAQFYSNVVYAKRKEIKLCCVVMVFLSLLTIIVSHILFRRFLPNKAFEFLDLIIVFLLLVPCVFLHELTHIMAMLAIGVNMVDIKIGHKFKQGFVYCHMAKSVEIWKYRVVLSMPFFLTGLLPFVLSIVFLNIAYAMLFLISLTICSGDVIMFLKTLKFKSKELVLDHAQYPAFYVLTDNVDEETFLKNELNLESEYKIHDS